MSKKDTYDDIDALLEDLKSDIEDTLMDEILDEVKNIELSHIENDVLSVYSPSIYKRRSTGGIDDPDNIIGKVKNMQLEVDNVTRFNEGCGTYNHGVGLADLINGGESLHGYFYNNPEMLLPKVHSTLPPLVGQQQSRSEDNCQFADFPAP